MAPLRVTSLTALLSLVLVNDAAAQQRAAPVRTPVLVSATLGDADLDRVERTLCVPIEQALRGLDGVGEIRSTCGARHVCVRVDCPGERSAALAAVAGCLRGLDEAVAARLSVVAAPGPVAFRVLLGGDASLAELAQAAAALQRRLEVSPDVDAVEVDGLPRARALVELDPATLRARDLDPSRVADRVRETLGAAPCHDLDILAATVLGLDLRLGDVAVLRQDHVPAAQVQADGGPAVLVSVRVRGGQSAEPARAALAAWVKTLPATLQATQLPETTVAVEVRADSHVALPLRALAGRLAERADVQRLVAVAGCRDPDLGVPAPERGLLLLVAGPDALAAARPEFDAVGLRARVAAPFGRVEVRVDERDRLADALAALRSELATVKGVGRVLDESPPLRAERIVEPDPARLSAAGLSAAAFATALSLLDGGQVVGALADGLEVVVRVHPERDEWWRDAALRTPTGWRPLGDLARVTAVVRSPVRQRCGGVPVGWLSVELTAGTDPAAARARLAGVCAAERDGVAVRWCDG